MVQSNYYKEGTPIKFNLMVRSKGNIIVKDKTINEEESKGELPPTKLYSNRFPSQRELEYKQCRYLISDGQSLKDE